ncbi:hypothetical protein EPN44_10305 [bacterium]|nr:MAG: hypothetical protein EPN44_10305 [bacterium]
MTAHAIAGWVTLAVVIGVLLVLAAYSMVLALRVRRIQARLQHPLLQRISAAGADLRGLESTRAQFNELSRRASQALASLQGASAERERLRRVGGQAVASIIGNVRTIFDLLA